MGYNDDGSTISNSYAAGTVTGNTNTGGLVGYNDNGSTISNSYAAGMVTGSTNTAGFLGFNDSSSVSGTNYFVDTDGTDGLGVGSCGVDATCERKTADWLENTLDETDLGWSSPPWSGLGEAGFPTLNVGD